MVSYDRHEERALYVVCTYAMYYPVSLKPLARLRTLKDTTLSQITNPNASLKNRQNQHKRCPAEHGSSLTHSNTRIRLHALTLTWRNTRPVVPAAASSLPLMQNTPGPLSFLGFLRIVRVSPGVAK